MVNVYRKDGFDFERRANEWEARERETFDRATRDKDNPNRATIEVIKEPVPAEKRIEAYQQYITLLEECASYAKDEVAQPRTIETTKIISQTIVQPVKTVVVSTTIEAPTPATTPTPAPVETTATTPTSTSASVSEMSPGMIASIVLSALAVVFSLIGMAAPILGFVR